MALPVRDQLKYWGIATVAIVLILYAMGNVILPFVLGGAVAYCLDPIADRFERLGLSRAASTVVITLIALIIFVVGALLVVPTLVQQSIGLVNVMPTLFDQLQAYLTERFPSLLDSESTVRKSLMQLGTLIESKGGALVERLVTSALGVVNIIVLIVLVPVVTFYLLLDWDRMVARIDLLLPRDHAPAIRQLAAEIDRTLASFIRGQGTVCLILGSYYAVGLMLVGLDFGLVIGAVAGLITFIPYVGALVGGALAVGLALFQFWDTPLWIGAVAGIFVLGQFLEGNILTPKLVGSSVGLHPVWLIFSLSVFGTMFGFVGMLVAVPLAASIGVLTRFGIATYTNSLLYRGLEGRGPDGED